PSGRGASRVRRARAWAPVVALPAACRRRRRPERITWKRRWTRPPSRSRLLPEVRATERVRHPRPKGGKDPPSAPSRLLKKPPAPRDPRHEGRDPFFSTLLEEVRAPVDRDGRADREAGERGAQPRGHHRDLLGPAVAAHVVHRP